jgi:lysozyme
VADIDKASQELDRLTKGEEGWRAAPYYCPARIPTIGFGCTSYEDGTKVKMTDPPITRERGQKLLDFKIAEGIQRTLEMVKGKCTTNQLVALVLCGFNIGWSALAGSSMIKAHNRGDYAAAARAFGLWNNYRPGGPGTPLEEHPVLTARRAREAAIYRLADDRDEVIASEEALMPQEVEPESSLAKSKIAQSGGGLITVGGAVAAVKELGDSAEGAMPALKSVRSVIDFAKDFAVNTLGITAEPSTVFTYGAIAVGAWLLYQRWLQRRGGWA